MFKIKETLDNYRRVLEIARKPDLQEFKFTAKVCGIGMFVVGILGFILYFISAIFIG